MKFKKDRTQYKDVFNGFLVSNATFCGNLDIPLICKEKDDIFPTKEIQFEGHTFMAPNNSDEFLRVLYDDYMQIPPEDKRLTHRAPITFLNEKQK